MPGERVRAIPVPREVMVCADCIGGEDKEGGKGGGSELVGVWSGEE